MSKIGIINQINTDEYLTYIINDMKKFLKLEIIEIINDQVLHHKLNEIKNKNNVINVNEVVKEIYKYKIKTNYDIIAYLLNKDMCSDGLKYVYGRAFNNERICVLSTYRFNNYYNSTNINRVLKELLHEIYHIYGLKHCEKEYCIMHHSRNITNIDNKEFSLCNKCKELLVALS